MNKIKASFGIICILIVVVSSPLLAKEKNKVDAFLNKGIFFQTEDEKYSLGISPRFQLRYAFANREGIANDAHSFLVRRLYLTFYGNAFSKNLTYNFTLNGVPGSSSSKILHYAYLNYEFNPAFQIKAGLHKIAFNRQEMNSSGKLQFTDRSLANERYNLDRSIGLSLHGGFLEDKIHYYLTVTNGRATEAELNTNNELLYAARLNFNILGDTKYAEGDMDFSDSPQLSFGLAGAFHHEEVDTSDPIANQARVMTAASDLVFKYKGFSLVGEVFFRNTAPGDGSRSVNDLGYYAQIGYFIIPEKFEIALRASGLFDDLGNVGTDVYFNNGSLSKLGGVNDGVDETGDSANEHEFSLAINYYIKKYKIKLQGQYTFMLDHDGTQNIQNHLVLAQAQIEF